MKEDGEKVYNSLQPGDYVLIEFGHNDICSLTDKKMRGSIPCAKDTCHVYQMEESKQYEVVYSFGWYLKKFIQDVREKGATPILVSLTPRNEWPHGKMERRKRYATASGIAKSLQRQALPSSTSTTSLPIHTIR